MTEAANRALEQISSEAGQQVRRLTLARGHGVSLLFAS